MAKFLIIEVNILGDIIQEKIHFDVCLQTGTLPGVFPESELLNSVNCDGISNTESKIFFYDLFKDSAVKSKLMFASFGKNQFPDGINL